MWAWQTWARHPFLSPAVLSVWFKQAQLEHTNPQSQDQGQSTHLVGKGLWKFSGPGSTWPPDACNPGIFESVQKPTIPTVGLIFRVGLLKTFCLPVAQPGGHFRLVQLCCICSGFPGLPGPLSVSQEDVRINCQSLKNSCDLHPAC